MKKFFSILAVCSVLAIAACNSAEHKEEGEKKDSTAVESTTPAPTESTTPAPTDTTGAQSQAPQQGGAH